MYYNRQCVPEKAMLCKGPNNRNEGKRACAERCKSFPESRAAR
jgi:hypothetical protein